MILCPCCHLTVELIKMSARHRPRADRATAFRCSTVICVLENPSNIANVAAISRSVDALGVGKLYIVTDRPERFRALVERDQANIHKAAMGSGQWIYTRCFASTEACLAHLAKNSVLSYGTSPHQAQLLSEVNFSEAKKVAVWFGNEGTGLSPIALAAMNKRIGIQMCGMAESLNLAVAAGVILHHVTTERRNNRSKRSQKKCLKRQIKAHMQDIQQF